MHRKYDLARRRDKSSALASAVLVLLAAHCFGQSQNLASKTQIVLLGTGTPLPDPDRSGPSTAIVVNGAAYIVDFGTGVVRQAAAARTRGVNALEPVNLKIGFLTHLHSDHTIGFADIIFTPWVMGRTSPLEVYGPPGTREMAGNIVKAYSADISIRTGEFELLDTTGYKVNAHEILPGVAYKDANVTVTAFAVHHGKWPHAYGYRFETADRSIVISGDASPDGAIVANCHGCDVLIHEVYTNASFDLVSPKWKRYRLDYHTSSKELAEIATAAKPGLLIIYHRANPGCDQALTDDCREAGSENQVLREIRQGFTGKVVAGHDLDVY